MRGRGMPPGGYRGRGGYNPNGRGGYGPPPRGGPYNYGPPQRGGYGPYRGDPMMGRGGRGGPPPGYGNRGPSPAGSYGRRPEPGYGNNGYQAPPAEYAAYNPSNQSERSSLPRAESPPPLPGDLDLPVGQAVEMDATTGSPSTAPAGFGQFGNIRESDGDVAGMVGLQQQRLQRQAVDSDASKYSADE